MFNKKVFVLPAKTAMLFRSHQLGKHNLVHIYTLIISWSEVTSVWNEVSFVWSEVTSIMGRTDFCWGEIAMGQIDHPVRTGNIHCSLHFETFTILGRGTYILISALRIRTPKSHALRTKNIHCVLCFGALTFSE